MVQRANSGPFAFREDKGVTSQDALVASSVHAEAQARDLSVFECLDPVVDELSDGRAQARRQTTSGHHGDMDVLSCQ